MKSQLSYDVAIRMSYRISLTHFAQHDIPIVSSTQFCYLDILVTVFFRLCHSSSSGACHHVIKAYMLTNGKALVRFCYVEGKFIDLNLRAQKRQYLFT